MSKRYPHASKAEVLPERIETQPSDSEALTILGKRFAWLSAALFVALVAGLWAANLLFPAAIGPVTGYSLTTSALAAVTFGGSFAAAMALRANRRADAERAEAP